MALVLGLPLGDPEGQSLGCLGVVLRMFLGKGCEVVKRYIGVIGVVSLKHPFVKGLTYYIYVHLRSGPLCS